MWRTVSFQLQIPYFLVRFSTQEGSGWLAQTSLLWHEEDLSNFCSIAAEDPHQRILQVARLSPPLEGERDDWEMIAVSEIWKGVNSETGRPVLVLIGKNGNRMTANAFVTDVERTDLIERIYSFRLA